MHACIGNELFYFKMHKIKCSCQGKMRYEIMKLGVNRGYASRIIFTTNIHVNAPFEETSILIYSGLVI